MADQNFMDLASKTASGIAGTDYMMLVNNSEAYKALVNDVAEAILSKLTSKSFSGLETTAKNVIGALNELNSKIVASNSENNSDIVYPIYAGLKVLVVFTAMGTTGINGSPPVMFILSTNYGATECSISYLSKPDNCTVKVRVSEGNAVLNARYDSDNANYVKSLFIPID